MSGAARYLTPREAAERLPGEGHDPEKIVRWVLRGVLVQGRRVRLRACKVGGRWLVAEADLTAFLHTVQAGRFRGLKGEPVEAAPGPAPTAQREARRRHREAKRVLAAAGIL